jgi:hypothetical protein
MTGLESWLKQATRHLSAESAAQVRTEIQDHFESARDAAIAAGTTAREADLVALAALGDAKAANCQYRRVLLTSEEARLLRQGNHEAQFVCGHRWLKWLFPAASIATLLTGTVLLLIGVGPAAQIMLAAGTITGLLSSAPFLPIYTPSRGRVFRYLKWVVFIGAFVLIFGSDTLKMSWLLISCLSPLAWIEWTRVSIRRKLPVSKWPRQLYL